MYTYQGQNNQGYHFTGTAPLTVGTYSSRIVSYLHREVGSKSGKIIPHSQHCFQNQGCGSAFISSWSGSGSSILGWIPIRIHGFHDQKLKKNYSWKKITFILDQTTIYLSQSLHKERPSYRRSLQLSKEAIQHFKTWTLKKIYTLVGHFFPSGSGSGSTGRLNPDPCSKQKHFILFQQNFLYNKSCSSLGSVRYTIATILRPEREGLTLSVAKPIIIKVLARINTEIKKVQVRKNKSRWPLKLMNSCTHH